MRADTYDLVLQDVTECTEGDGCHFNIHTKSGRIFHDYGISDMANILKGVVKGQLLVLAKDDAPVVYIDLADVEALEVSNGS